MTFTEARQWVVKNNNIIFFVGGFVFDALTLTRIDAVLDLSLQFVYILAIVWMMYYQAKEERGLWQPSPRLAKVWHLNVEALHFVYGSLLSAYVVFYFKSSTFSRSAFFLILVFVLMFLNEMPQIRSAGSRMRLGLFALCLASYLNYLLPVIIGRMGGWVFALAMILTALFTRFFLNKLTAMDPNPRRARWVMGWPPAVVLLLIMGFYVMKWIPPVPLSMQFAGIYHNIEKQDGKYALTHIKWPWYQFWRTQDRPFLARPGDQIQFFTRVFGPRRFRNQVYLHWSYKPDGAPEFQTSDRIPLSIYGGRGEGFRGVSAKANYQPGRWKVAVETDDGRVLGEIKFDVVSDTSLDEREWITLQM